MKYRILGRTNLEISEICLGMEHLNGQTSEEISAVIEEAVNAGINYFDVIFCFEHYLLNIKAALERLTSKKEEIHLALHIRSGEEKGQYKKLIDLEKSKTTFEKSMEILGITKVDMAIIQFVDNEKEFKEITQENGVLDYAVQLKEKDKASFIGMSTHSYKVAQRAAKSGKIDMVMVWLNFTNHQDKNREEMLQICLKENVGVLAMKPFAGGNLLEKEETGEKKDQQSLKEKNGQKITPVQCHSYVLAQPGVTASLFGVKNTKELRESLAFVSATAKEKDFAPIIQAIEKEQGKETTKECQYCNHCLPCTAGIDIAKTLYLLKKAVLGQKEKAQKEYHLLEKKAIDCVACEECMKRCPFAVEVPIKMRETIKVFGE